jgi:magnesium transporter
MLNVFVAQPQGLARVETAAGTVPADALWIDLIEPTPDEEQLVESTYGIEVPTREEMKEIEASNRLYEENGVLYLTITIVTRLDSDLPESSQITFILAKERLITNRYSDPLPFQRFIAYAERHPGVCSSAAALLAGLIEAIVNRMADVLERVGADLDQLSSEVFSPPRSRRRSAKKVARDSRTILSRVGQNGDLTSKARESLVSLNRLLTFVQQSAAVSLANDVRARFRTLGRDVLALSDHASFLGNKATFLLEATLGMLNIEQNNIIKIFSVAAVVFLPPTLIASIYGMNFHVMPELDWLLGYPFAIGLMVVSAILPYLYFKRRGWL